MTSSQGDLHATLDSLLDAQRRMADADSSYYRSLVEYQLAVKNVQLEKGTLLDYCQIFLSEGRWPSGAYTDAEARESRRGESQDIPFQEEQDTWLSRGTFDQLRSVPPRAKPANDEPLPTGSESDDTETDPAISDESGVDFTDQSADVQNEDRPAFE